MSHIVMNETEGQLASGNLLPVNGTELFVRVIGPEGAPWVVLLNSMAADTNMWSAQVSALSKRYRVMCMDWRGHGGSLNEPGPYSLDMLVNDVLELMNAVGASHPHIVGTSLGGMIAMVIAIEKRAPIASLTVCSALSKISPTMKKWWEEIAAQVDREGVGQEIVESTLSRWFTPEYASANPQIIAQTRSMIARTSRDAYSGCIAAFKNLDLFNQLSNVDVPTLFLVGKEDPASTPEIMQDMHRQVKGSLFEVINHAAHLPSIEQPKAVNQALLRFIETIPERGVS